MWTSLVSSSLSQCHATSCLGVWTDHTFSWKNGFNIYEVVVELTSNGSRTCYFINPNLHQFYGALRPKFRKCMAEVLYDSLSWGLAEKLFCELSFVRNCPKFYNTKVTTTFWKSYSLSASSLKEDLSLPWANVFSLCMKDLDFVFIRTFVIYYLFHFSRLDE